MPFQVLHLLAPALLSSFVYPSSDSHSTLWPHQNTYSIPYSHFVVYLASILLLILSLPKVHFPLL